MFLEDVRLALRSYMLAVTAASRGQLMAFALWGDLGNEWEGQNFI